MPFCIVLTVVVGTSLGWLLVKITRVPYHLRGLVLACCAVGIKKKKNCILFIFFLIFTLKKYMHTKTYIGLHHVIYNKVNEKMFYKVK